jgi:hypothetical protein
LPSGEGAIQRFCSGVKNSRVIELREFPRLRPKSNEPENAIAVRIDDRLHDRRIVFLKFLRLLAAVVRAVPVRPSAGSIVEFQLEEF